MLPARVQSCMNDPNRKITGCFTSNENRIYILLPYQLKTKQVLICIFHITLLPGYSGYSQGRNSRERFSSTAISSYPRGICFKTPQWMPEPEDSTEPYIYYGFSSIYIPMIKFIN